MNRTWKTNNLLVRGFLKNGVQEEFDPYEPSIGLSSGDEYKTEVLDFPNSTVGRQYLFPSKSFMETNESHRVSDKAKNATRIRISFTYALCKQKSLHWC